MDSLPNCYRCGHQPCECKDGITLYHADCRDVLPLLEAGSVDLLLTDPPFSIPVKYQDASGTHPRSYGDLMVMEPFYREVFGMIRPLVLNRGQVYVSCDAESYPVFHRICYPLWAQNQMLVWYKPTGRRGRGWQHAFELLLHCRTAETMYSDGFRQDVVGIMPVRTLKRQHPAEKPGDLMQHLADALGPANQAMCLDPFAGSGTTGRACKDLGRKCILIEIEEKYCEIAANRLRQEILFT